MNESTHQAPPGIAIFGRAALAVADWSASLKKGGCPFSSHVCGPEGGTTSPASSRYATGATRRTVYGHRMATDEHNTKTPKESRQCGNQSA